MNYTIRISKDVRPNISIEGEWDRTYDESYKYYIEDGCGDEYETCAGFATEEEARAEAQKVVDRLMKRLQTL